ncbi:Serine/threonine-protein kinase [Collariella sp. IMI 366227]|nr:Serine/threonine-protein kinase [Collariella sp. IMI 366227]
MGQGFSLATPRAGGAGIDVPELSDLVYERSVGTGGFMKSIRARHHDGVVLAKVLIKPYPMSLDKYKQQIIHERRALADVPNALPYQRAIETETNGYIVRQFLYNSLYDRLSTRPFLEDIEKRFLAFQLLCGLRDCHAKGVYHGDIKTENILVTSWNWLYLADFSGHATSLFLETPIFSLSQLYSYRRGEYDPGILHLSKIPDKELREMIAHMIQPDPQKRYSAEQYLEFFKGKVFPEYFYSFLHQYMELITDISSGYAPRGTARVVSEADQRIERVWSDFDKISYFLGYQNGDIHRAAGERQLSPRLGLGHFPVRLNIPNNEHHVSADKQPSADDGTLIFLTLVVSSLRNTAHASARVKACDILLAFAERLTDEAKLDRVLPYLVALLRDKCDLVVVSAIRAITQLLDLVKVITPVNSQIFLDYIMPRLEPMLLDTQRPIVRATYASCLGKLAITADRFLSMAATLRADGSAALADPEIEPGNEAEAAFAGLFDNARRELTEIFEAHTKTLIEDSDPFVRRAFLTSVPDLCIFFGAAQANDIILTHLNTYLNDRDWMLKCAFFDTIVGISAFLGSNTLEKFILPLMVQAITDPEEHVVQGALRALAELAGLGLLTKRTYSELVGTIARFAMHPNIWIREAAAEFVAAGTRFLGLAYLRVQVLPQLRPYLKPGRVLTADWGELGLLEALQRPLSRAVFEQALLWAAKADRGDFWRGGRNEEDEQWLSKLRNLGLAQEDEPKLLALREFIWRLSQIKARDSASQEATNTTILNSIIPLRSLGITPQTVLFDEEPLPPAVVTPEPDVGAPRTIKDALLDASMSIDDPVGKKRRAALNNHRSRLGSRDNMSPMSTDSRRPLDEDPSLTPTASRQGEGSRDTSRRPSSALGKTAATLSPTDDGGSAQDSPYSTRRGLRHQTSAMNLMNRKDSGKTGPETGTTETNAFGEMEGAFSPAPIRIASTPDTNAGLEYAKTKLRANHTYTGNDPSILKMLDAMYVDNYPHDVYEYGPMRGKFSIPAAEVVEEYQLGVGGWGGEYAVWCEHFKQQQQHADATGSASVLVLATNRSVGDLSGWGNKEGPRGYEAWEVDEDRPEGMLGRFATNLETSPMANVDRGVRAMIVGTGATDEQREVRHAFIVTAGSDKKLRFWDLSRIENSVVFSGLQPDEGRPTFTASHPTPSMTLNTERWPRQVAAGSSSSGTSTPTAANGGAAHRRRSAGTTTHAANRPPRSTVISLEQQQLLRSHLDAVTDVALLESPYTMTVSVDRGGVVFVFQ